MEHILGCHEIIKTDFVRAENCAVYDRAGRRYVDCESGIWCTALGHNHPRIQAAMQAQIQQVIHLGTRWPSGLAEAAASALLDRLVMPDGKCVFLCSGSEAVELCVQAARRLTERPLFLTFADSYLAAYGSAGKKRSDEWYSFDWQTCSGCPDSVQCGEECPLLQAVPWGQLGGMVFEPGSASGQVRFPPRGLVRALAGRVQGEGGLLVVNEVTTGMGRTGAWFGFYHYGLSPDMAAAGKGLGNGYPVSAAAFSRQTARRLEESGFYYAQSHQNDPLGAAVAREVLAVMAEEGWVERGCQMGERFLASLREMAGQFACVKEVRGRGMMAAVELVRAEGIPSAREVMLALLERGYLAGYSPAGNALRFDPALTIPEPDLQGLVTSLEEVLLDICPGRSAKC